ncbi:hypothetical protein JHK87_006348 [Glycine soja]|nr:hypothetical protein JHK87_006348 [Glycine soja]
MKSLGSTLHEVSTEAREAKENLLHIQPESESYDAHIEDLKLVLKSTNEKYNSMLDEAEWEQREGMAVVAARATRLPIYSSFSKEGNLSDLFAKEEEFSTLFNVIGIGVGIQLASTICASM